MEAGYTRGFEAAVEVPFLAEERVLLDTIATRVGSLITRVIAEEKLNKTLQENETFSSRCSRSWGEWRRCGIPTPRAISTV